MKQGTKIKNYCNECHHETWQNGLFVQTKSESNYEMSWYQDYGILQCAGCDTICFRVDSSDSESYENDEFGNWIPIVTQENYPPSNEGFGIIENIYEIPNEIRDIYNETVKSISDGCYTLAGIGLRATVEAICLHENIPGGNLDTKINRLVTNGFISKDDADKLHAIRFIGNDAAHDIKAPIKNKVIIALKIIEHLISSKYGMQDEINKYLDLPINTYDEFKIFLNKKVLNTQNTITFTLQSLIGKDRRRINNNNFPSFIQQYESEIENGQITILEDVTTQIQASQTNNTSSTQSNNTALQTSNNTTSQKIYRQYVVPSSL